MSQPNEESKKEKKIKKSILKTLLYYSDDIALAIYKSIKPALRIKTASQKDYGGANMDRQKVLLDLAAELIKLATDGTELKRAKKRRNIALGTGLAGLGAGIGGLGAALGIARKNPQEVQEVQALRDILQDTEKQVKSLKRALKQMRRKAIPLKYRVPLGISQIGGLVGLGSLPFAIYYAHKAKKLSKKERTNKMQ